MINMKTIYYALAEFIEDNIKEETNKVLGNIFQLLLKETITDMWNNLEEKGNCLCPEFYKNQSEKIVKHVRSTETINYDLFLNSIALSAIVGNDHLPCKNNEKINRLLMKMSISNGINISQKKSGKIL